MKLFNLFKKKPILMTPETNIGGDARFEEKNSEKPGCRFCRAVITAGRSGEKELSFIDGDTAKVEIINESNIDGRMCYTLNIMNDPEIGWNDIPIKFCPFCGRNLRRKK